MELIVLPNVVVDAILFVVLPCYCVCRGGILGDESPTVLLDSNLPSTSFFLPSYFFQARRQTRYGALDEICMCCNHRLNYCLAITIKGYEL